MERKSEREREKSESEKNNYAVIIGSISTERTSKRRIENLLNSCAGKGRNGTRNSERSRIGWRRRFSQVIIGFQRDCSTLNRTFMASDLFYLKSSKIIFGFGINLWHPLLFVAVELDKYSCFKRVSKAS